MSNPAILYGCADPDCGYRCMPTTMKKPYEICPLCNRSPFVANPPPQNVTTGKAIDRVDERGKVKHRTVVRPHLQESFERLEQGR